MITPLSVWTQHLEAWSYMWAVTSTRAAADSYSKPKSRNPEELIQELKQFDQDLDNTWLLVMLELAPFKPVSENICNESVVSTAIKHI